METEDFAVAATLPAGATTDADTERGVGAARPFHSEPADQLGRYLVLGTLGHGGMGTVLEAFDRTLDRRVAIKVLRHGLHERDKQRLLREAQAMAKLSHPNVVQVYEAGEVDGQAFVAMELVRGKTLHAWMRQQPRPSWRQCVSVFIQAGEGLAAAHARGLVHRDFKPSNALVDEDGRVRVLDFGLARRAGPDEPHAHPRAEPEPAFQTDMLALDTPMTRTGAVLGTPAYMPLEQLRGHEADARSDQFGFCVSLHEALYGERPFEGDSIAALVLSMTAGEPRPAPKGTTVPIKLRHVVLRGLATAPEQRWPSMDALLAELRRQVAPPRRGWLVLGLAVGLTALGVGLARHAAVGFRCEGAREQLSGIWDDARKQEVRAAILGTGLVYASETWERIEPELDARTQAWIDAYTEICEATRVSETQTEAVMELRMTCLGRQRIDLRAAVDVLAHPDAQRVRNAVELVAGLPSPSRCDDVAALESKLPLPDGPEAAAEVEAQRVRLAEARALDMAGDYERAHALASTVVDQAEALGFAPLVAEALHVRGAASRQLGKHGPAEADLERAFLLAVELEHGAVELDAARGLVLVTGVELARGADGRQWGKLAWALASRADASDEIRGAVLGSIGSVVRLQSQLDEAMGYYQDALARLEAALGPDHPEIARALNNIASLLAERGDLDGSLAYLQRALALVERGLGPSHPEAAVVRSNIGLTLTKLGRLGEARSEHERALALTERALGPQHPQVAWMLTGLANTLLQQGHTDEALALFRRALAIREATLGPRHPEVARSLSDIGDVLSQQGKPGEALEPLQRALAIQEATLGPRDGKVAVTLSLLGSMYREQGEWGRALECFQRALAIIEETIDPRSPNVAIALRDVADVLRHEGRRSEALVQLRRALAIIEDTQGPASRLTAFMLVDIADVELEEHDPRAAREHAERAISIYDTMDAPPGHVAWARYVLAQALWSAPAQRARARSLVEQARQTFASLGESQASNLAAAEAWLVTHVVR